jgi:23S rRNA-/tRNA-specific pseudouridylate synthase
MRSEWVISALMQSIHLSDLKCHSRLETAANRLDRLVSGIMIIAITTPAARKLGKAFQTPGTVHKEYVARVLGCFPEEKIICEEPLLSIDKQIGVNVVHPEGRVSLSLV